MPQDERRRQLECHPQAGCEVPFLQLARGAWKAVRSQKIEFLGGQVKDGSLIANDGGGKVQRVAHAQVDRQAPAEPPILLQIELDNPGAGLDHFRLSVDTETAYLA